ncbi:putative peptidyl-tRNA hydrolase PTRHD1 [Liolophura sinensis]|uniref:putative peptidyl-tRNA hydrolase PTRHD1 n=1 Tax=Liolophura sinensis TaxID=3198878 RepID=UPI00315834D6
MSYFVQYVVLRKDLLKTLKWPFGAVVTQACHACTAVLHENYGDPNTQQYLSKIDEMHKVVLEADGESDLRKLAESLTEAKVAHKLWTEQPEGIPTCLAVMPYKKEDIQSHFKGLKLFK